MIRRSQLCKDPGDESFWEREQQIQGPDEEWSEFTVFEEQIAGQWDGV